MTREKQETLVKELNIAVSKLLELYQWDHLDVDKEKVRKELEIVVEKAINLKEANF